MRESNSRRGRVRAVATLAAGLVVLVASGCARQRPSPFAQPEDRPVATVLPGGGPLSPPPAITRQTSGIPLPWIPRFSFRIRSASSKLVPPLGQWVRDSAGGRRADVVIGYVDPLEFPRLPVEALESGDTLEALAAQQATKAIVDSIQALRDSSYTTEIARLGTLFGATSIRTHLLTRSITANLTLDAITSLSHRWEVTSVELVESGVPPPQGCTPSTTLNANPCEARQRIGTDPYRDAGHADGRMTLFDTGVNTDHVSLKPLALAPWVPGAHGLRSYDCLLDPTCASTVAGDLDVYGYGHGSKSASLLVGLDGGDPSFRGIGDGWLTAFRVYHSMTAAPTKAELDPGAYQAAADGLIAKLQPPPVLLVEAQASGDVFSNISRAADLLYGLGSVVIAPVGNVGEVPGGGVGSPGVSARVLAVGARTTKDYGSTSSSQAWGAVPVARNKPDLQAPTSTYGARGDDDVKYDAFLKTSGAAPYAAGAARIVRDILAPGIESPMSPKAVDPGQVYAALIAFASNDRPYPADQGAGTFRLPANGVLYAGKTTVATGTTTSIMIPVPPGSQGKVRVAIWWPDPRPLMFMRGLLQIVQHGDVDLGVMIPGEKVPRTSTGADGVFESATGNLQNTTLGLLPLVLQIHGKNVGCRLQTVYWAVVFTPS